MLNKNSLPISYQVDQNLPDFVKTNHEKFVQFLVNYYEYLDQNESVNDYIRNVITFMDIDQTTEFLLNNFFEELKAMPFTVVADKRLLAQHIIDLYASKGSIESFKLLFRILFNESINVIYPSEKILRASDGRWLQEAFIELETVFGDVSTENIKQLQFENSFGAFRIDPTLIEQISPDVHRFHYDSRKRLYINPNEIFFIYDSNGEKQYVGKIRKSPSKILIQNGGRNWRVGAILTIPGDITDTIARVVRVGENGKVTGVEIIEHGNGHTENQITIVSPYPNKPNKSNVVVTQTLTSFEPLEYNYTIDITDYTSGFSETIDGDVDGNVVIDLETLNESQDNIVSEVPFDDITIEEWLSSRATFVMLYEYVSTKRGYYTAETSIISNNEIRLQDGLYYQLYSYVIQTSQNIDQYKQAIGIIHPAGLRYFAELQKEFEYSIENDIEVGRSISADRLYLNENILVSDIKGFVLNKPLADVISSTDSESFVLIKPFSDAVSASHSTASLNTVSYMVSMPDYFTSDYILTEKILTIS